MAVRRTTGSTWCSRHGGGADTTAPTITARFPGRSRRRVRERRRHRDASTKASTRRPSAPPFQLRNPGAALVPADVSYDGRTRTATLTRRASSSYATTLHRHRERRREPRQRPAGNALAADHTWSFTTADRHPRPHDGPGRSDPVITSDQPVQPLLRRDPPDRRLERVLDQDISTVTPAVLARLRRRHPRRDAAHRGAGDDVHRLGQRRRQPDRHAARQAARGLLGLTTRVHARRRLPAGQHRTAPGRGIVGRRCSSTARRPVHAERRDHGRDALHATRPPPPPIPRSRSRRRLQRRPGRGLHLRPRAVDRLHAPGQPGLGGPGARRLRADPLRRPVLRWQLRPTGST